MHLTRFQHQGSDHLGAFRDGNVVNLSAASNGELTADLSALLRDEGGELAKVDRILAEAGEAFELAAEAVTLLPVANPSQIICLGLNYRAHAAEAGMDLPESPVIFTKSPGSLVGHGQPIVLPAAAPDRVDYEAELAFVIGKQAKHVSKEDALSYIAGYTCANDVSARDLQFRTSQWVLGKMVDSFCPLGPALVTANEVPDPHDLMMYCHVNDQEMQAGRTDDMIFDIPYVIEYLSAFITLYPGDLILTGTPPGVGSARKPPVYLKDGDVVKITIEGLGTLSNPVVAGS